MATDSQTFDYLCARLKNMGYKGDLSDIREIKRFLKVNSNDPNYEKAILHLNTLLQNSYNKTAFKKSSRPMRAVDSLRSQSSLYSTKDMRKYA